MLVRRLETAAFIVQEFRCPGCPPVTAPETAPLAEIVLPRQGAYVRRDSSGSVFLDRTVTAFFEAGRPYVIEHPKPRPDLTTVISLVDEAGLAHSLGIRFEQATTFRRAAVRTTPPIHLAHAALLRNLDQGAAGRLAAEESAVQLIALAVELTQRSAELARPEDGRSGAWKREIAVAVADFLNARYREPVTLQAVAAHAGYSVFHLCRIFQSEMGMPIHKYLMQLRLEAALGELTHSDRPITEVALDLGFASSSHFTTHFTRWAGLPPSRARLGGRGSARI